MKDFNWKTFEKRVLIDAKLEDVYDAWTKCVELEKWFLKQAIFYDLETNDKIDNQKNVPSKSNYSWTWYAQNYSESGKILTTNTTDYLEFTFAGNCIVKVSLTRFSNKTMVTLIQEDIPENDESKLNVRLGCAFGWTFYLINLKSYLEGGIDLRNKEDGLIHVVNN